VFDFAPWLTPLKGENPSGRELRNDQRFHDLERLMQPRIEVTRDERNQPVSQTAIPVDWSDVLQRAEALRADGRDLRLLVIVVRALANVRGLAGLADGLSLVARTFEAHWDTMYPELRPANEPREAALRRLNALRQLQMTEDGLLGDLRATVFVSPRGVGALTGGDLERGTLDARTVEAETASGLNAAERAALVAEHEALVHRVRVGCAAEADRNAETYAALVAAAGEATEALSGVEATLAARLGDGLGPTLPDLARFLGRVRATVERAPAGAGSAQGPAASAHDQPRTDDARPAAGGFPTALGSRDDVLRCLDMIIAFYDRTEPSSPIPHLARRIRRMVPMDFLELMEDLAPSGLKEFRLLAGVSDKSKPAQKGDTG
jgi:type VI secretion system protein ImpA